MDTDGGHHPIGNLVEQKQKHLYNVLQFLRAKIEVKYLKAY